LATVKANAYGHGIREVAKLALEGGADWLGIHSLEEGRLLREDGVESPILILGYVPLESLREAVDCDLRLTVYNEETIAKLAELSRASKFPVRIHLKVETGTNRQGVLPEDVLPVARKIVSHPRLILEGLSSHFADIEDTTDHSYAIFQMENFRKACRSLEKHGIDIPVKHIACTAAAILFPETHMDMVRIGIGMYGLWPSRETFLSCILKERDPLELKPVLSWKTRVAQVKRIPAGSYIGYGCTYKTTRETKLAVLPVGYFDGYARAFSNMSYVLIRSQRAALRGRVAMNFIMVDVTDIPEIRIEDVAVLIGKSGKEHISADRLAMWAGTIHYEIVTRINPLIPRLVVS